MNRFNISLLQVLHAREKEMELEAIAWGAVLIALLLSSTGCPGLL
jgi:hypothetical protein